MGQRIRLKWDRYDRDDNDLDNLIPWTGRLVLTMSYPESSTALNNAHLDSRMRLERYLWRIADLGSTKGRSGPSTTFAAITTRHGRRHQASLSRSASRRLFIPRTRTTMTRTTRDPGSSANWTFSMGCSSTLKAVSCPVFTVCLLVSIGNASQRFGRL